MSRVPIDVQSESEKCGRYSKMKSFLSKVLNGSMGQGSFISWFCLRKGLKCERLNFTNISKALGNVNLYLGKYFFNRRKSAMISIDICDLKNLINY